MITNLVLLAGFWASVGSFFKWLLVGIGLIAVLICLIMFAGYILDENANLEDADDGIIGFIIAGIIGLIPATFWLFIPYWETCQWIIFSLVLFFTIITNIRQIPIVRIIFLIASVAWGIFLFIKYIIIPYSAFFILLAKIIAVIAIVLLIAIAIKAIIKSIKKAIYKKHTKALQNIIEGMPIPDNAVFDSETDKLAKEAIAKITDLNNKIKTASNDDIKIKYKNELYEQKIYLFYQLSLRAESNNDKESYSQFENQLKNAKSSNDLRIDREEKEILQQIKTTSQEVVESWKSKIEKDQKKNYMRRLTNIKNQDVTESRLYGLVNRTSIAKLKSQTSGFAYLANTMVDEVRELGNIQNILNKELTKIRLTAYRNIYLAVELINYQRDNAGGKTLYVEKDLINADTSSIEKIDINFDKISLDYNNIYNSAMKGFESTVSSLRNIGYNPGKKAAVGIAAISTVASVIQERLAKIGQIKEQQYRIIKEIERIIPQLHDGRAKLLRTIEVMEAIIKSNNGFYVIYAPLRNKVFNNNEEMTIEDTMDLVNAINDFKNISTTKL